MHTLRQTRNIHSHLVHMAPLLLFQGEDTYLEGNDALTNKISITSMNVRMQHIAIKHHVKKKKDCQCHLYI